jgi:hypothetical protein
MFEDVNAPSLRRDDMTFFVSWSSMTTHKHTDTINGM